MKRGNSNLSFIVGLNKESGKSSHAALSSVKRTLGEKRVGHAGTLDPFASGVLVVMVGPSARLNRYITGCKKSYIAEIALGFSTNTDDICGEKCMVKPVCFEAGNAEFAQGVLNKFRGKGMQIPPAFSAIKLGGKKACNEARRGNILELTPRPIEVFKAELIDISEKKISGVLCVCWKVCFEVSSGTYIRSLARDIAISIDTAGHLCSLERISVGSVELGECVSEESSADVLLKRAIDPLRLLSMKAAFLSDENDAIVANGGCVSLSSLNIMNYSCDLATSYDTCTSSLADFHGALADGEKIALLNKEGLKAIYRYEKGTSVLVAECVFGNEVMRGKYL